ncbi:hypothetical protein [Siccirubricoccus sp. G192]|uniref:hypothetical protein n=1 Tax=Siccirubricoccus sp. G192 TaxID=2849651 RepID=UPI001C2C32C1|nr:hypothetical protein [Siccirubricoccus sp. G192]MBV1799665.1 hypothetical protein [Siccirubricoccus sp. G192]
MKSIGMGLAAMVATSALAYPLDIGNHARRAVSGGLPVRRAGASWGAEVIRLRTRDWAGASSSPFLVMPLPALLMIGCGPAVFNRLTGQHFATAANRLLIAPGSGLAFQRPRSRHMRRR